MTENEFKAELRQLNDRVVLDLAGDINAFAEESLEDCYQKAEVLEPESIALNFNEVDYINSTGIALIVSLLAQARKSDREIQVYGLSDHYRELFDITRLSDFMTIYEDEQAAFGT